MPTAKVAVGSIFGTITSAAGAITSLFDTGASSVSMLNKYVSDAAEKQRIASDYDLATFEDTLVRSIATETAKADRELSVFFKEDPENRTLYQAAHERIRAAVELRRNPT